MVSKRATGTAESGDVGLFAVRFAILPAAPDDALPLVSQGADGRMKRTALGAMLLVIGCGPEAVADTFASPLMPLSGGTLRAVLRTVCLIPFGS